VDPVTAHLHTLLRRDLDAFKAEIAALPDEAALWHKPAGIPNAAGNLALHVSGNLQHFIGGILGGNGYVRNREQEFAQRSGERAGILQELARARSAVESVLPGLGAEALAKDFPVAIDGVHLPTGVFLMRMTVHLAYHLGQVNFLRRMMGTPG